MSGAAPIGSTSPRDEPKAHERDLAHRLSRPAALARLGAGGAVQAEDELAVEMPVALRYNCESHVVMMASPADLVDFAYGFSIAEGVVGSARDIAAVEVTGEAGGIAIAIEIPPERADALASRARNLVGRTGCGLCGVAEIEAALRPLARVTAGAPVPLRAIDAAVAALPARQTAHRASGAVHAAAFADRAGRILALREDVGRHNALDKLIGALIRAGVAPDTGFIVVTSRCSMEMVQKTVTFGCAVLVAVSAPTSLAVELADAAGLTVCAFARGRGCNVYSHPERIALPR